MQLPKANGQRLLGIGFGLLAACHSPEITHTASKLAVGATTGTLVWLFSKAAGKIAGQAYRKERRASTDHIKGMESQIKETYRKQKSSAKRHPAPGRGRMAQTSQNDDIYKPVPSESAAVFHNMRIAAKVTLAISLAQGATAYCTYHFGRPAIAKEAASLSRRYVHH